MATPPPSAGSLRMPVGCPVLTQRRGLRRYFCGRVHARISGLCRRYLLTPPCPLRPACEPALALRSPVLAVRRDFRHFVTAITGGGWVLCEIKALSHGTKGQSNAYHRFGYCRRDRIRRLVGLYDCAVEGWEGGCACGVGSDLTACAYVALASRRNTGRILAT